MCIINCDAQDRQTLLQHINEIKSQKDNFFWSQFTHADEDTAKISSTNWLLTEVNLDRKESEFVTLDDISNYIHYLMIERGSQKQCFAYIRKQDIDAINKDGVYTASKVENNVITQAAVPQPLPEARRAFVPEAFIQRIMIEKNFSNTYRLLKALQAQGQVLQFGKLRDVEDYASFELILFDMQSQAIISILSAEDDSGCRRNLLNGSDDSLSNYPTDMTAVIWYIRK